MDVKYKCIELNNRGDGILLLSFLPLSFPLLQNSESGRAPHTDLSSADTLQKQVPALCHSQDISKPANVSNWPGRNPAV